MDRGRALDPKVRGDWRLNTQVMIWGLTPGQRGVAGSQGPRGSLTIRAGGGAPARNSACGPRGFTARGQVDFPHIR